MKDNKQIMCDECKKNAPIDQIRYSIIGEKSMRLCSDCRDRTTPRKNRLENKKVEIKKIEIDDKKLLKKSSPQLGMQLKNEYFCTRCRYKFRYDTYGGGKLRCPYCSSPAYVTTSSSLSSGKLLKELLLLQL